MSEVTVNSDPHSSLPSNLPRARAVRRLFDVRRRRPAPGAQIWRGRASGRAGGGARRRRHRRIQLQLRITDRPIHCTRPPRQRKNNRKKWQ